MKKTKEVTRIDTQIESVLCNKCEKECYLPSHELKGETFFVDCRDLEVDYEFCTFELCTECLMDLISTLRIPPEKD